MRLLLTITVSALAIPTVVGPVAAQPRANRSLSPEELSSVIVLADGAGHFLVAKKPDDADSWIYYGDETELYEQKIRGSGGQPGTGQYSWNFVAPGYYPNEVGVEASSSWKDWSVQCGDRKRQLTEVTGDARERILERAKLLPRKWERQDYLLARDERGQYYVADALRDSRYGMRLFVGRMGKMRELVLTDLVSDSEGDIFFSRAGKLRIDGSIYAKQREATWIVGKKRTKLVVLDSWQNSKLVYRELGLYNGVRFGTPCDDP